MANDVSRRVIEAAGGLVWRRGPGAGGGSGGVQIALVRRDRYDDWTLPKGKLEPGETELRAAVREVREETGFHVATSRWLERVRYRVNSFPKTVAFWAMEYRSGEFAASKEIDALDWLDVERAADRLTYDVDRQVLDAFRARAVPDAVVVLVRHARAGKRAQWKADDRLRPLDRDGRAQARRLATFLAAFGPNRVVSANRVRCEQTVAPLAAQLGVAVERHAGFCDESFARDQGATLDAVRELGQPGGFAVVASQGGTIPGILDRIGSLGGKPPKSSATRKGAVWTLSFADGEVVSCDGYPDAAR